MSQNANTYKTLIENESNPKAVFVGGEESFFLPLALYLAERNVDLYAGKSLEDAFFGTYFFYTGDWNSIKDFLISNGARLPKTLLFFQIAIQSEIYPVLEKLPRIKLIKLNNVSALTDENLDSIIEFFFGEHGMILALKPSVLQNNTSLGFSAIHPEIPAGDISKIELPQSTVTPQAPEEKSIVDVTNSQKQIKREILVTEEVTAASQNDLRENSFAPDVRQEKPSEDNAESYTNVSISSEEFPKSLPDISNTQIKPLSDETVSRKKNVYSSSPNITGSAQDDVAIPHKTKKLPLFIAIGAMLLILAISPIIIFASELLWGGWNLLSAKTVLENGNLEYAQKKLETAETFLTLAQNLHSSYLSPILGLIGQQSLAEETFILVQTQEQTAAGLKRLVKLKDPIKTLIRAISGEEKGVVAGSLIADVKGELTLVNTQLGSAQANLKSEKLKHFLRRSEFSFLENRISQASQDLEKLRTYALTLKKTTFVLPELLGLVGGKKTYLVLFQNNMELRPSGGFIGSLGLISFEDGVLKDFKVEDVYTADGALQGHVDPPLPIKNFLGQEHWYLRDSNWNPNFAISAQRAAWFLEKELEVKVDGVIGVDVTLAEYLLQVSGQLDVPDYNEKITAENLYLKLQLETQKDFFPGSTKKRDLLGSIAKTLMLNLLKTENLNTANLLTKMHQALDEKHLMFYFPKSELEALIAEYNWGGLVKANRCVESNCILDALMIVDANLGVNKVNYFVRRNIEDQVSLDTSGTASHDFNLTYKNSSSKDNNLGGVYKNYVRVYVHNNADLKRVEKNALPLTLTQSNIASDSAVAKYIEGEFTVFAYLLDVAPQEEITLTFHFSTKSTLSQNHAEPRTYIYQLLKQPGVVGESASVTIGYPGQWTVRKGEGVGDVAGVSTLVKPSQITYNTGMLKDQLFTLNFLQ